MHQISDGLPPIQGRPPPRASQGLPVRQVHAPSGWASIPAPQASSSCWPICRRDKLVLRGAQSTVTTTDPPIIVTTTRTSTNRRLGSILTTRTVTVTLSSTTSTTSTHTTTVQIPAPVATPIVVTFSVIPTTPIHIHTTPIVSPTQAKLSSTSTSTAPATPSSTTASTITPLAAGFGVGVPLFVLLSLMAFWYLWYVRRGRKTPIQEFWRRRAIRKKERREGMKSYRERQKDGRGAAGGLGTRSRGETGVSEPVALNHTTVAPPPRAVPGFASTHSQPPPPPPPVAGNGVPRPSRPPPPPTQDGVLLAERSYPRPRPRPPPAHTVPPVGEIQISPPPILPHQPRGYSPFPPQPRPALGVQTIPPRPYSPLALAPIQRTNTWNSLTTTSSSDQAMAGADSAKSQTPPPTLPPLKFQGVARWRWEVKGGGEGELEDGNGKRKGKGKQKEWYDAL